MKAPNFIFAITVAVVTAVIIPTRLAAQEDAAQGKKAHHHHYKVIDMGTFGGPQSSNFPLFAGTLNKRGVTIAACG
jgi:hypothetical protein